MSTPTSPGSQLGAIIRAFTRLATDVQRIADSRQSDFVLSTDGPDFTSPHTDIEHEGQDVDEQQRRLIQDIEQQGTPAAETDGDLTPEFRKKFEDLQTRHQQAAKKRDDRARGHIKAVIEVLKEETDTPTSAVPQVFISGMLTGLASSVEILDGGTAEKALESVNTRLAAAIGEAYLAGNLPPRTEATADVDDLLTPEQEVRGVQGWMALDLHRALGLAVDDQAKHQGHRNWGDWWATLCAHVAQRTHAAQAHARALATPDDITARDDDSGWHPSGLLAPDPEEMFFPIGYTAVVGQPHPISPNDPPYLIDLNGYTEGDPLQERVHRLIVHRSLVTSLVRDLVALEQPAEQGSPIGWEAIARRREAELKTAGERTQAVEQERDGAYRERAHLVALLAAMTEDAVIAPASDVDEPGWQIVYLTIGGSQASWHISPLDGELFECVEHVPMEDPRARWDGHSTDDKYARIRQHTRRLFRQCGLACAEGHTYTGRCESAPASSQVDDFSPGPLDLVRLDPSLQASAPAGVDEPCAKHPTAPVIGGRCGGCTVHPTTKEQ